MTPEQTRELIRQAINELVVSASLFGRNYGEANDQGVIDSGNHLVELINTYAAEQVSAERARSLTLIEAKLTDLIAYAASIRVGRPDGAEYYDAVCFHIYS